MADIYICHFETSNIYISAILKLQVHIKVAIHNDVHQT